MEPLVHRERHFDMLREVEMDRLVRLAAGAPAETLSLRARALAWLGGRLSAWGELLERRYAR